MEKKKIKIKELGELHFKSSGFFYILTFKDALTHVKRYYFDYDFVKFIFDGQAYQMEIKYTITSQKSLL